MTSVTISSAPKWRGDTGKETQGQEGDVEVTPGSVQGDL